MTSVVHSGRRLLRQHTFLHRQKEAWGRQTVIAFLLTYISYVLAARIGLSLMLPDGVSPVWPASGVALAMVLLFGPRMALAVGLGNLTIQFLGVTYVLPVWAGLIFALGAALEPLISATILQRWFGFDSRLMRLRDIVALAVVGAPAGSLLTAVLAVLTLYGSGAMPMAQLLPGLETFWFGNAGGVLMLAAPLLIWLRGPAAISDLKPGIGPFFEAVGILILLSALALGLPLATETLNHIDPDAFAFLCFPLIAWASIRLDLKVSTCITLLVSIETIITAHWALGLFRAAGENTVLFNIQLFVLSLNATNQLLGGLAQQERQAAGRLTEREEFLSLALRGGNDGLFELDRVSRSLWLSPRWKQQLGYDDTELPNSHRTWWRLVLPSDRKRTITAFKELDRGSAAQGECILRLRHRHDRVIHILCRVAVKRNGKGRITRLVGTHTDISDLITARQELEHQTGSLSRLARDLNQQRRLAEAANDTKTAFLATVSHEVRTPLNGVIGMLNLLVDNNLTEEQRRQASVALNSAEDMLTILNDILDVTKLEAGRVSLETTDCDINAVIDGVVTLFIGRAAAKGVSLSAEIAGNVPHYIRADQPRLRQILMNLVGNAVKFTLAGDIVLKVTTAPMTRLTNSAGDINPALRFYLIVDVVDTGIGIPADKIERLFDRFQQADDSIARRFGGSGLGLTICRQLVDLMGGQISVDSKPGAGSTFRVAVPCSIGQSPAIQALNKAGALADIGPCHVLVVEDNAVNSALVVEMLKRAGHQATVADNGRMALSVLGREQFDVILMDVQMPEMDGITTTQWIRALDDRRAHLPIIALTADTMSGSRERYLTAGFTDYLEKPVRANKLVETIARHVVPRHPVISPTEMDAKIDSAASPENVAAIDLPHLNALRRQMSAGDVDRMISDTEAEFEFELRRLKIAVGLSDRDACHLALQALSEDALQVGAIGFASYSQRLAAASNDIEAIFAALAPLQLSADRAVAQLRSHVSAISLER